MRDGSRHSAVNAEVQWVPLKSTIGSRSRVMALDHPTSSPGTRHGREPHTGQVHFQIGPIEDAGPRNVEPSGSGAVRRLVDHQGWGGADRHPGHAHGKERDRSLDAI